MNISAQCPFACAFFLCADGTCATNASGCALLYDCPGNGCLASDTGEYFCACANGFGGATCQYARCDATSADPYAACTCGNPPPLKMQPPADDTYVNYTNAELAVLNRRNRPRVSASDVQNLVLQPDAAPFGIPVKPCNFMVAGPNGE